MVSDTCSEPDELVMLDEMAGGHARDSGGANVIQCELCLVNQLIISLSNILNWERLRQDGTVEYSLESR